MHSKSTFYSILALSIKDSNKSSRLFDINHEQFNFLEYKNTANVRERNLLTIISKILYRHSKTNNVCLDGITAAMNAGIPIIGFDSGVTNPPEGAIFASASTDNYAAGVLAAEETFKLIKDKTVTGSKIGVLSQDATGESVFSRGMGFIDKMKELIEAEGLTVSVEGHAKFENKTEGADVIIQVAVPASVTMELSVVDAQNMINDDAYVAIYGSNQHSAEALITADENLGKVGKDGIIGVGFDAGTMIKNAVKSGKLAGAITQDPMNMGRKTVELAVKAANGEPVEDVDTGCQWYTSDNMDDPSIAPNLYD